MRRKLLAVSALFFFLLFGAQSAWATSLTWERGQVQHVEMDAALAATVDHVALLGQSSTIPFIPRALDNGHMGYDAVLTSDLALGEYTVRVFYTDGTVGDFANVRVVEFQSAGYNPLGDYQTISLLSFTFFTVVLLAQANDSFEDDQTTAQDLSGDGFGRSARQRSRTRKGAIVSIALDHFRSSKTVSSSRVSPIFSRLLADGGYLQYSLGELVLLFPILGIVGGVMSYNDIRGVGHITTPSLAITLFMIILGVLDAGSAFIGAITFGILAATSKLYTNVYDYRTFIGLMILWISPSLLANKIRPLRKSFEDSDLWDRATDVVIGSLLMGWTIRAMVLGLNGCAHLHLPLERDANLCGVVGGAAIAIRYLWEEYVNHRNPLYLAYLSPSVVHEQDKNWRLAGWFAKGALFLFFAVSFLGLTWHLWAAVVIYMFPVGLSLWQKRFPNFPALYQLLPVGIASMILMTFINKFYSSFVNSHLKSASDARNIFLLMSVPGLAFGIIRAFGRKPQAGDVRWYMRPRFKYFYRVSGPIFLALASALTVGWIG